MSQTVIQFTVVLFIAAVAPLHADPHSDILDQAVSEYRQGLDTSDPQLRLERFRRAKRLFHQVAAEGKVVNADLQANLGSAALLCEQRGEAILAYRRALAIQPGHQRAQRNLQHARSLLPEWVPRPQTQTLLDTFFFWHQTLSRSGRALTAALCFALTAILIAVAIRWRRAWARNVAILPAILWVVLMGTIGWERWRGQHADAVVIAAEIVARAADSAGAPARFAQPLPDGTEVTIMEQRDGWARIRLANGRDAWVRASAVEWVRPRPAADAD